MELIVKAMQNLIDRIEFGDITRNSIVNELENLKTELEEETNQ